MAQTINRLSYEQQGFSLLPLLVNQRIVVKTVTEWSPEFGLIGYLQEVNDEGRSVHLGFDEFRVSFKHTCTGDEDAHWEIDSGTFTLHQRDAMTTITKLSDATA